MGAPKKITELTATTALTVDDLLAVVDDPGGTPVTKKITFANLLASIAADVYPGSGNDVVVRMGDDAAANKVSFVNESAAEKASLTSTGAFSAVSLSDGTFSVTSGTITGASLSADQISAAALDIGANAFTVNSIEIVGSDGEVNKAAVEDSGNWDAAYTHVSSNGTDHGYINQDVQSTASPTFAGLTIVNAINEFSIDGTLGGNSDSAIPTEKAVKTYADSLLAANDAMVYKGATDCSSNPNYPAADAGHTYKVSVAGKIGGASGVVVEIGDMYICLVDSSPGGDQAAVGANWNVLQANIDGAVIGPASSTDHAVARFDLTTGKLLQNSVVTISDAGAIAGASLPISDLSDPAGNTALSMGTNQLKMTWTNPTTADGALELEATGAYTGDILHIHQHTGNPASVDLVHLEAADTNVVGLRVNTPTNAIWVESGVATFMDGLTVEGEIIFNDTGVDVDLRMETTASTHTFFVRGSDGHIGIGTSAPDSTLTVQGSCTINRNQSASGDLVVRGDTEANLIVARAADDRVGIGIASPDTLLHIEGGELKVYNDPGEIILASSDASGGGRVTLSYPGTDISGQDDGTWMIDVWGNSSDANLRIFEQESGSTVKTWLSLNSNPGGQAVVDWNSAGGDIDFLVQGDTVVNVLYVNAGNDNVNMGGTGVSAHYDLALLGDGVLCTKETTTPTADASHAKWYSKSDNWAYFQDGAGTEHKISGGRVVFSEYKAGTTQDPSTTATTSGTAPVLAEMTHTFTPESASNKIVVHASGCFTNSGADDQAKFGIFIDGVLEVETERRTWCQTAGTDVGSMDTFWQGTLSVASHTITIRFWGHNGTTTCRNEFRGMLIQEIEPGN